MKNYHAITLKNFKIQLKDTIHCKHELLSQGSIQQNSFQYKKLEITEEWLKLKIHLLEWLIKKERAHAH